MRSLPAQQAKIVQCLAAATGATTVKEIAALTFIDERSCSKQLGELRNRRYVQNEKRGKESYYELSEPLMRLCLEVKNQRGKPLQLIARFVKVWFTPDALQKQLKASPCSGSRADAYRASALELDGQLQIPVREATGREFEKLLIDRNHDAASEVADELLSVDRLQDLRKAARVKFESGDFSGVIANLTCVIEVANAPISEKANAMVCCSVMHSRLEQMQEALASYQSAIYIAPPGSESSCGAMFAVPKPLVEIRLLDDVSAALRRAFEESDRKSGSYGGTPDDLFWMVLRRGGRDWNKYVGTLMPLYAEFGVTEKLARGLVQLIQRLDEADFSPGQLDEWNAVWHKHGADVDDLEISLQCLSAAIEAIKTKSDRPLFQLPQEVRSLVRSLLDHTLGPVLRSSGC